MNDFKAMLMSQVNEDKTEPEIRKMAESIRSIFPIDDLEYNEALDVAIRTIEMQVGESFTLTGDTKHTKWFEEYYKELKQITRWDRYYEYLFQKKGFKRKVLQSMRENLFKITDLLGNPDGEPFKRKGLIVGDVQSGKTANYVGLMNLATDVNYKVIIVLTGTTNTLREQTQIRIQDGLGNVKSKAGVKSILNAEYDFNDPTYLTSPESDFSVSSSKNFQQSIETTTVPIVLVTKKNVNSLKNIYTWLSEFSKKKSNAQIDSSLLLIDDESDLASVNTNGDENPTTINKGIRDILELFTHSSYTGFTATPFANIFIDPNSDDAMSGQDLFPKDYIYVLGESDEYTGVQSIFSEDKNNNNNNTMLELLEPNEVEMYLPLKHKKNSTFSNLSPSMKEAIRLFFIANVIRDLRGSKKSHRSMLFNISRFINLHSQIKIAVVEYVERLQRDIRLNSKLPYTEAVKIENIAAIKKSFDKYYSGKLNSDYNHFDASFEEILKNMNDSVYRIKVAVVNGNLKEVDYLANEEEGERVIVIGGFALARGLTLEGLMISYYYRNSVMYDSLLQMGRWFGYRGGYEDLCKVFMSPKTASDFKFIALATLELKDDLEINAKKRDLTPKEFGIKIRSGQAGLIITSRNKMRTGKKITAKVNFNKDIIETTALNIGKDNYNEKNNQMITNFVEQNSSKIVKDMFPNKKNISFGLRGIVKSQIIDFIKNFIPEKTSGKFDSELIIKWLRNNSNEELENWDVAFVSGSGSRNFNFGNGIIGKSNIRTVIKVGDNDGVYKNSSSRLGSPTDGLYGLDRLQKEKIIQLHESTIGRNGVKSDTISQKEYFDEEINRKPIILIYSVSPTITENRYDDQPIPLISIGIPDLGYGKSKRVDYTVNQTYMELRELEREEEE